MTDIHPSTNQSDRPLKPRNLFLWFRDQRTDFLCLFLILLLGCSYFVTQVLLTDHTIPNSFLQPLPSVRSAAEARWGHEILVHLLGGAGNQAVFNVLGMAIIVINGFLFAEMMSVVGRTRRFIVASLVTLSPIFLEYFSFSIDAFSYAAGDMAALLGVILLARAEAFWRQFTAMLGAGPIFLRGIAIIAARISPLSGAIIVSAIFFVFALSIYQPKISLIAVLLAFHLLMKASAARANLNELAKTIGAAAASFFAAVLLYWLSYKLISLVADSQGFNRTYVNSIGEIIAQTTIAYSGVYQLVVGFVRSLPLVTNVSLFFLIGAAFVIVLYRAFRARLLQGVLCIGLIALLPIGMRLAYVINHETFSDIARAMPSVAFFAAFAAAICLGRIFSVAVAASLIVVYSSFVTLVQESSAAAIKTWHETAMITRIISRLEPLLQPDHASALVVFGSPPFDDPLYVRASERPLRPQTKKPAFISYRQIALTNFFLGTNAVKSPDPEQRDEARRASRGRNAWPAPDSVFRAGDIIVVILDDNIQETDATW